MVLKGKKVFVTGADGFIGSHLVESLVSNGAKVKALSQYNSFNNWGWLEALECLDEIEVVCGDVRDPYFINKASKNTDVIFNLAALIAIPYSYAAPSSYVDTNISGTLNICEAALKNGAKRLVHISTSEVYGTAKYIPIDEKHPLQPQSPYSASKIGADAIAESFFRSFGLPVCIARPFNTYGPKQSARAIIPTIITQIASGREAIRLGNTAPRRDFNYVKDTCAGLLNIASSDKAIGETINIGSNSDISIKRLFELIKGLMCSDARLIKEEIRFRPGKSEVMRLLCDNSKIKKLVGYKPQYSLEAGLKETIEWFVNSDNLKAYKEGIYNV
ncbi:MAG: SDR family NAD(P)-dependent oxidoreductase [Candidatus Omnitrophica bacterium]|nr:SDR family NAD(P)-dependent oxidoreductase [Candidatus Omnitrophota bacterium]